VDAVGSTDGPAASEPTTAVDDPDWAGDAPDGGTTGPAPVVGVTVGAPAGAADCVVDGAATAADDPPAAARWDPVVGIACVDVTGAGSA
jgi:hypothetical protein